jgi:acetyl-CoA carboxylase biotin carboxyl carrier protein
MNFDDIKRILEIVREHELSEFELERGDFKIRVKKHAGSPAALAAGNAAITAPVAPSGASAVSAQAGELDSVADTDEIELAVVKSPIVGTFYRASEPGASPFVDVGDVVKKGQVLCIIEAMKLMNEIDSEYDGEIVNIYVESGQPVQYGERLFAIRTKS